MVENIYTSELGEQSINDEWDRLASRRCDHGSCLLLLFVQPPYRTTTVLFKYEAQTVVPYGRHRSTIPYNPRTGSPLKHRDILRDEYNSTKTEWWNT